MQCGRYTSEEVALGLQDLVNLQGPDLPDSRVGGVQEKGLDAAVWHSGGHGKLTRVTVCTVLQAQTAHLRTNIMQIIIFNNINALKLQLHTMEKNTICNTNQN